MLNLRTQGWISYTIFRWISLQVTVLFMTHTAISIALPLPSPSLAAVASKQQVHVSCGVSLTNFLFLLLEKLDLLGLTHKSNQSHGKKNTKNMNMTWKSSPWFFDSMAVQLPNGTAEAKSGSVVTRSGWPGGNFLGLSTVLAKFKLQRINLGFLHTNDVAECRFFACCRRSLRGESPGCICFWSTLKILPQSSRIEHQPQTFWRKKTV